MTNRLALVCFIGFLSATLIGCSSVEGSSNCATRYGSYIAIAKNGNMAVDACKEGRFGLLVKYEGTDRWLQPEGIRYMSPTFSQDGQQLVFVGLDQKNRESSINLLEMKSGQIRVVHKVPGAISFAAIDAKGSSIFYWQGLFRESGKTLAAGFSLFRLSLHDQKVEKIDGPYFIAHKLSVDSSDFLHYSYEDGVDKRLKYIARKRDPANGRLVNIELPQLAGTIVNTSRGYYYTMLYMQSPYLYCIAGPGIPEKSICPGSNFDVTPDGSILAYVNEQQDEPQILKLH